MYYIYTINYKNMKNTNTHKVEIHKADNKTSYHVWCPTLDINTNVCQTELDWFLERYYNKGLNLEITNI
jgi:hypothetical protein